MTSPARTSDPIVPREAVVHARGCTAGEQPERREHLPDLDCGVVCGSTCEQGEACLGDSDCATSYCAEAGNDFDPCKTQCGINGNPGPVTACANSECNVQGACAL